MGGWVCVGFGCMYIGKFGWSNKPLVMLHPLLSRSSSMFDGYGQKRDVSLTNVHKKWNTQRVTKQTLFTGPQMIIGALPYHQT